MREGVRKRERERDRDFETPTAIINIRKAKTNQIYFSHCKATIERHNYGVVTILKKNSIKRNEAK